MNLTCAIIDDEPLAVSLLASYVKKTPFLELKGEYYSALQAMEPLKQEPVDLLFLDIQMPELSGMELSRLLPEQTRIIFTTAFEQYALDSYKVNALDYLLKPIGIESVRKALEKFKRRNPATQQPADPFTWGNEVIKRILVPCKDRLLPIKMEQIAYFYSTGGNGELLTFDEQRYPLGKSLDTLILKLDPTLFFRVNRQFILSKEAIESIIIWFDNRLRINLTVPTP